MVRLAALGQARAELWPDKGGRLTWAGFSSGWGWSMITRKDRQLKVSPSCPVLNREGQLGRNANSDLAARDGSEKGKGTALGKTSISPVSVGLRGRTAPQNDRLVTLNKTSPVALPYAHKNFENFRTSRKRKILGEFFSETLTAHSAQTA